MPLPSCGKILKYTLKNTTANKIDTTHVPIHIPHQLSQACQSRNPLKRHINGHAPVILKELGSSELVKAAGRTPIKMLANKNRTKVFCKINGLFFLSFLIKNINIHINARIKAAISSQLRMPKCRVEWT